MAGGALNAAVKIQRDAGQVLVEKTGQNQTRAARLLGLTRDALRYRMKKYGLL